MSSEYLVSADWLHERLDREAVKIVEAPWKPEGYDRAHLPGARRLPRHPYLKAEDGEGNRSRHVLGSGDFRQLMADLGIGSDDEVVVYDDYHSLFAARFWWVCAYHGFRRVRILDGGWHAWVEQGWPVSLVVPEFAPGTDLEPVVAGKMLIGLEELKGVVDSGTMSIWDTRREEEYDGSGTTSNRRRGHIPDAHWLEWTSLLQEPSRKGGPRFFKPADEMAAMLAGMGLTRERPIVTHCQAGIRAAFGSFVLEMLGYSGHRLYDASMAEWANEEDTPLVIANRTASD